MVQHNEIISGIQLEQILTLILDQGLDSMACGSRSLSLRYWAQNLHYKHVSPITACIPIY